MMPRLALSLQKYSLHLVMSHLHFAFSQEPAHTFNPNRTKLFVFFFFSSHSLCKFIRSVFQRSGFLFSIPCQHFQQTMWAKVDKINNKKKNESRQKQTHKEYQTIERFQQSKRLNFWRSSFFSFLSLFSLWYIEMKQLLYNKTRLTRVRTLEAFTVIQFVCAQN